MANVIKSIKVGNANSTALPVYATEGITFLPSPSGMRVDLKKNDGGYIQLAGIIPDADGAQCGLLSGVTQTVNGRKIFKGSVDDTPAYSPYTSSETLSINSDPSYSEYEGYLYVFYNFIIPKTGDISSIYMDSSPDTLYDICDDIDQSLLGRAQLTGYSYEKKDLGKSWGIHIEADFNWYNSSTNNNYDPGEYFDAVIPAYITIYYVNNPAEGTIIDKSIVAVDNVYGRTTIGEENGYQHISFETPGNSARIALRSGSLDIISAGCTYAQLSIGYIGGIQGLRIYGSDGNGKGSTVARMYALSPSIRSTGVLGSLEFPFTKCFANSFVPGSTNIAAAGATVLGSGSVGLSTERFKYVYTRELNTKYIKVAGGSATIYLGASGHSTLVLPGRYDGASAVNKTGSIGTSAFRWGTGYFNNLYSTAFWENSDENLKTILRPIETDLDELSKLRKVYFEWKDKGGITGPQIGVIAQDVKKLYPEIVSGEDGGLLVSYEKLGVIALDAVDKVHQENKELKVKCEELERRIEKLEKLLM